MHAGIFGGQTSQGVCLPDFYIEEKTLEAYNEFFADIVAVVSTALYKMTERQKTACNSAMTVL